MNTNTPKLAPLPSLPSSARKAKTPQNCACGCSGLTKGGRFIPGHDSRMHGWALRIAGGHDTTGITPGERKAAEAHIARTPKLRDLQAARVKAEQDAAKSTAKTA